jgi:hypothetical protein
VIELGPELGVPVVDLWSAFIKPVGWKEGDALVGSRFPIVRSLRGFLRMVRVLSIYNSCRVIWSEADMYWAGLHLTGRDSDVVI